MRRWVTEMHQTIAEANAVIKPKADITKLATTLGYRPLEIFRYWWPEETDASLAARIDGITAGVDLGDIVIYQYPSLNGPRFDRTFVRHMIGRGAKTIGFIHDSEALRFNTEEEISIFNSYSALIVHSQAMIDALKAKGVKVPMYANVLFDYLQDESQLQKHKFSRDVIFAGNFRKARYLANWRPKTKMIAFGKDVPEVDIDPVVDYRGPVPPDELPSTLPDGFGLVWDENNVVADYSDYTQYNNPHKASLYLSSGVPIIINRHSPVAKLVEKHHLGVTISSLDELDDRLSQITEADYQNMIKNVNKFGRLLRMGYFTQNAILQVNYLLAMRDEPTD